MKVTFVKTDAIAQDTYYFKPAQVLDCLHRHRAETRYSSRTRQRESSIWTEARKSQSSLSPALSCSCPEAIWHRPVADRRMISQATVQPAGMEKRTGAV